MRRLVQEQLDQAGIDSPDAEARLILAHVLDISLGRIGVLEALGECLTSQQEDWVTQLVAGRIQRIPLQHLTGTAHFYGLELKVEPGVFIPRPETEVLVETTLERLAGRTQPVRIMDLCTGSGAIAAALADQLEQRNQAYEIYAIELTTQAAAIATKNLRKYNAKVLCTDATDLSSQKTAAPELAAAAHTFDAVVSNPPYIPLSTPVTQAEASQDPDRALYGGSDDGTTIPLAIADVAQHWLATDGFFMMEHDHTHAQDLVDQLHREPAWHSVQSHHDLTGTPRFVSAIRRDLAQLTPNTH